MPYSHSKCIIPPAALPSVQVADPLSSSKALIHANNELQHLTQELMKANQREGQLCGTLKNVRANHSWSLAECNRLRTNICNQRFIVNYLKSQFGAGFSVPGLPSQQKAPFIRPSPASESSTRKNHASVHSAGPTQQGSSMLTVSLAIL